MSGERFWRWYDRGARADFAGTLLGYVFDWKSWVVTGFGGAGGLMTFLWSAVAGLSPLDVWVYAVVVTAALLAIAYFLISFLENHRVVGRNFSASTSPLEVIFDSTNPSKRFWSQESPKDENGKPKPGVFWEYRVAVKNNSSKTVRNVSVSVEHIGQNLPIRPVDAIFDKIRKGSCDLKPGADELVPIVRWPIPVVQAGMLASKSALEYGPIKVIASGDDVPPAIRIFQFDYQSEPMLFDSFETSFRTLKEAAAELYGEIVLTKLGKSTKDQCASEEEIWDAMGTIIIHRGRVYGRRPGSSKMEEIPKRQFSWYSRLVGGAKIIRDNSTSKKTLFTDLQISRSNLESVTADVKSIANLETPY
jgi:hypothetical protein